MNKSEINKRYRQKKLEEDPDYTKEQSAKRRVKRLQNQPVKIITRVIVKKEKNKINSGSKNKDEIIQSIMNLNPDMKYDTVKQYVTDVGNLYEKMFNKPFDFKSFNWVKEDEKVVSFINSYYTNLASRRTHIGRIFCITSFFKGFEDTHTRYGKHRNDIDEIYKKEREDGRLTETENKLWINWADLLKMTESIDNSRDNFLIKLYTELPPRRSKAYSLLTYVNDKDILENKEVNYAVFNKKNELVKVILNNYKTVAKYGVYVIDKIPDSLKESSKKYIDEYGLKSGAPVFPNRNGDYYSNTSFSGVIKKTFNSYTGKKLGSNVLRHSYITDWSIRNKNPSVKMLKEMSLKLGHSIEMMHTYNRHIPP